MRSNLADVGRLCLCTYIYYCYETVTRRNMIINEFETVSMPVTENF